MGMDLIAIIEHKKVAEEIISIAEVIDTAKAFRKVFSETYPNSKLRDAEWNGPKLMTSENLEKIWVTEENGKDRIAELEGLNFYAEMDIPYAELTFHRHTIEISPHGLHKYGNFRTPKWAGFILNMNREIAKLFGSSKIVYCVDSYEPQSILWEYCVEGQKLGKIIELGNSKFGEPPKEIDAAVKNLYFIDEFNLKINELQDWNWQEIGL
jgi:hypothetical protein